MDNQEFRKLLASKSTQQDGFTASQPGRTTRGALGGKKSSFVPMTPRNLSNSSAGVDFARQVRERNAALRPTKKFKSSAPRGTKFGAEYTDRAKARAEDTAIDDKAERLKALEEQMKLDQISPEVYFALRDEITGGNVENTHLIKGLDRKLLERVRAGEDVMGLGRKEQAADDAGHEDVEDELEKAAEKVVEPVKREKVEKKGVVAVTGARKKRTRDDLLAELKAQRKAAAEARDAAAPKLNDRWAKVDGKKKSRVETDSRGREILVTVDEDGKVKRRVRKVEKVALDAPDASKTVLGADIVVPLGIPANETGETSADDDEEDIFEGVGADYNPLPDADDDDKSDVSDDVAVPVRDKPPKPTTGDLSSDEEGEVVPEAAPPSVIPAKASAPRRNYFGETTAATEEDAQARIAGIQDVIKKAAKLDPLRTAADPETDKASAEEEAKRKRRAQMLANDDRDLQDMDMGFGSSRLDDEADADGDGAKVKLSEWKDAGGEGSEGEGGKGGGKKKQRKPKKRKGDANSMGDIMKVLEVRREGGKK
ncbi:hypothetical protein B0A48_03403 [Cryoendolithus antarcticus]|uniref:RED-like N-terminal domain-containing protein n=1 Tax=Cryoendolithus antarcticus TaxID=1507870 RepID=A0A1V8TJX3_9PEZI|nr:hypothetical protein B0A48_03403 [Cryoendolithus antarcticus]